MKKLSAITSTLFASLILLLLPAAAFAQQGEINQGINEANGGSNPASPDQTLNTTIANVVNILSVAAGVVAVIMIIIAGLRYTTSAGNPEAAKGAKNTILYAIIGLVIVALAQIIVHFVLNKTP